jgi:hypothetical protein
LISVSIQDIRPNAQDTSNFYLANIYQTVAESNRPNSSSSLPISPPPFSPPNYAVWVNSLWFMSLVISLTCALLATLLQQWARRYLKVTQPRYSLHKRARIRAFFSEGVEKSLLPWAVEALPALVHVSLFLFFAGLVVFLWNIDLTTFKLVLSWVSICTTLYGCITFMPVFRHGSPYNTPLSLPAWQIVTRVSFTIIWGFTPFVHLLGGVVYYRFRLLKERYRKFLAQGMQKSAEDTALSSSSEIDARAFIWTFGSLDEDRDLERFFSGLPDFRTSKVVDDPLPILTSEQKKKLSTTLVGLFDRTFSSDLIPEPVKIRRASICVKALDPAEFPYAYRQIVDRILFNDQWRGLRTADFGNTVRGWGNNGDQGTTLVARAIVTGIIARVKRHDDSWFVLASNELGIPEPDLRDYASHGDSLSFAILIHVTRQQFTHYRTRPWPKDEFWQVLKAASKFNVQDTLPGLQYEFCALWNHIVLTAQNDHNQWMAWYTLGPIRNIYLALHQGTDSSPIHFSDSTTDYDRILLEPSSYPSCNVPDHHPVTTLHTHDVISSTTFARVVPHDQDSSALIHTFLSRPPDTPSSSAHAPLRVDETLADVSLLGNTSPNSVPTRAPRGSTGTFASTLSPTPMASASPPGTVTVQHTADRHTSSEAIDIPSLPSPTAVLDNTLPTDAQLSLHSPMTGSDHAPSHSSLLASTAPFPSRPRLPSAPVEGDGSAKVTLHKEKDARDSPSAMRGNIMVAPDLLPQLPPPPDVSDVDIMGPSQLSLGTEKTGDHPHQYPWHGQDNIV